MALRSRPKTTFGLEIGLFNLITGITQKDLATMAGVSYATMMDVCNGRSVGRDLMPKTREMMDQYLTENAGISFDALAVIARLLRFILIDKVSGGKLIGTVNAALQENGEAEPKKSLIA